MIDPLLRQRREANKIMRRFRSVPCERHVHFVRLTATTIPASTKAIRDRTRTDKTCWMLSKRGARELVERDRAFGGQGSFDTFEYRRCKVCSRVLVGADAADYRERLRWPREKRYWPWGPTCSPDCKPPAKKAERAIANGETKPQRVSGAVRRLGHCER
jgi:hypothetical protein